MLRDIVQAMAGDIGGGCWRRSLGIQYVMKNGYLGGVLRVVLTLCTNFVQDHTQVWGGVLRGVLAPGARAGHLF